MEKRRNVEAESEGKYIVLVQRDETGDEPMCVDISPFRHDINHLHGNNITIATAWARPILEITIHLGISDKIPQQLATRVRYS